MEIVRFGDLYLIPSANGVSRPSAVRGQGYKMVNMGELFSNDIIHDIPMERVSLSKKEKKKFLLQEDDLLFARQSLVAAGAGKCSIVKELGEETTFESHLIRVRLNKELCNPWYYFYQFQLPYNPVKTIVNQCAQAGIRGSELREIKVFLPALDTQNKIALVLSTYDNLIENNNKRIKLLEQMAESLYKEWFVRFRFPGYEDAEFEEGIPLKWETKCLGDFGIILDTGSRPSGGIDDSLREGVPSLGAEAIKGLGEFDYSSVKYISHEYYSKMRRGKFDGNAILIYKDGAYIGKTTIFRNEFPFKTFAVNEHVFLLKADNFAFQNYLYFTLHQKEYFYLMQTLNRNAAQPGLAQPDIKRIKITVPTENVVSQFNAMVDPILDEVFQLAKANRNIEQQRDRLLPRLMSGKLDV